MNIDLVVKRIKVKKPVKFVIRKRFCKSYAAKHVAYTIADEILYHEITINIGNVVEGLGERDIETLIVHELIHAWQAEKGYKDTHGKSFQRKAKQISGKLGMPRIYLSCIDT